MDLPSYKWGWMYLTNFLTRKYMTQGHFIVERHVQIETRAQLAIRKNASSCLHSPIEVPQAPSNKLNHASRYSQGGRPLETRQSIFNYPHRKNAWGQAKLKLLNWIPTKPISIPRMEHLKCWAINWILQSRKSLGGWPPETKCSINF